MGYNSSRTMWETDKVIQKIITSNMCWVDVQTTESEYVLRVCHTWLFHLGFIFVKSIITWCNVSSDIVHLRIYFPNFKTCQRSDDFFTMPWDRYGKLEIFKLLTSKHLKKICWIRTGYSSWSMSGRAPVWCRFPRCIKLHNKHAPWRTLSLLLSLPRNKKRKSSTLF